MSRSNEEEEYKKGPIENWLDEHFEPAFFKLRYVILAPVILTFFGAVTSFAIGVHETISVYDLILTSESEQVTVRLIEATDSFLFGLVLIVFSFGSYDLFISELEPAEKAGIRPDWLKFANLGELKNVLAELILIILVVLFLKIIMSNMKYFQDFWSFLVIPIGVILISVGIGVFKKLTS